MEAARAGASIIEQPVPQIPEKYNLYDELEIEKLLSQIHSRKNCAASRSSHFLKLNRRKSLSQRYETGVNVNFL